MIAKQDEQGAPFDDHSGYNPNPAEYKPTDNGFTEEDNQPIPFWPVEVIKEECSK